MNCLRIRKRARRAHYCFLRRAWWRVCRRSGRSALKHWAAQVAVAVRVVRSARCSWIPMDWSVPSHLSSPSEMSQADQMVLPVLAKLCQRVTRAGSHRRDSGSQGRSGSAAHSDLTETHHRGRVAARPCLSRRRHHLGCSDRNRSEWSYHLHPQVHSVRKDSSVRKRCSAQTNRSARMNHSVQKGYSGRKGCSIRSCTALRNPWKL